MAFDILAIAGLGKKNVPAKARKSMELDFHAQLATLLRNGAELHWVIFESSTVIVRRINGGWQKIKEFPALFTQAERDKLFVERNPLSDDDLKKIEEYLIACRHIA